MLCFLAALLAISSLATGAWAQAIQTKARQALLIDYETGSILFQKAADEAMPPASLAKLMTLYIAFKALKAGEIKLEEEVFVSVHAWRTGGAKSGGSAMFLPPNSKVTVGDLMAGIIVESGNDASIVIAERLAGTEQQFARNMTEEARKLGFKVANFGNSTGLPHPENRMTARELAILSQLIIKEFPDYYPWFAQKEFRWKKHRFINRNPLLFTTSGADGLKTGHLSESGYGLVASAVQDGRRLILVLNGLSTMAERKEEGIKLLDWGQRNFAPAKIFDASDIVGEARVWGGTQYYVKLSGKGDVMVLMPRSLGKEKYKAEIVYKGPLKPPIAKGDQVATLRVTTSLGTVAEAPVYAAEVVGRGGLLARGLDSLVHLAFRLVSL
jgi:D-alanyl-D-alanine carboxypeptidase (penicillin-binding protein 5/6)